MLKTWFLPPDFTFTTDGPLRMGMVLAHWSRPTDVLAELGPAIAPEIVLPNTTIIVEPNQVHNRSRSRSNGLGMLSKLEGIASASLSHNMGWSTSIDYSKTDHEVRFFADPLAPDTVRAIAKLPEVQKHMDSGLFGKRPVYLVSGLRIAMSSFTVTTQDSSNFALAAEGSGPPAGVVSSGVGGSLQHNTQRTVMNTYDTSPGAVFAYRLHIIRGHRARMETGLFSHKRAFLTGTKNNEDDPLVLIEMDTSELDADLEEKVDYRSTEFEGEICVSKL